MSSDVYGYDTGGSNIKHFIGVYAHWCECIIPITYNGYVSVERH